MLRFFGLQIRMINPHIANTQILGLIPLSQIRKFLSCADPQNSNSHNSSANRKSANLKNDFLFCTILN
jgi:hypothetical protein